jgi:hypothetical protein
MPSKSSDPRKRLLDIRDNIRLARAFIKGFDYEAFRDNQLLFYAVTRANAKPRQRCRGFCSGRTLSLVIPGRASWREPGIHNHQCQFDIPG